MKSGESFAYNYLIFRDPIDYILILFPSVIGILSHIILFRGETDIENVDNTTIILRQYEAIDQYLVISKYVIIVLLAFFCCYRWSLMQYDGSYGFWLTLGISKQKFFILAFARFVIVFTVSSLLGLATIMYISGFSLPFLTVINIILLLVNSLTLSIGIAIFLGNVIKNPEIASIIFLLVMILNQLLNTDPTTIVHKMFQAEFQYSTINPWSAFFVSLIINVILNFSSFRIHVLMDMDL